MTVGELLDWLDGQGLTVTDYDELHEALFRCNVAIDDKLSEVDRWYGVKPDYSAV